MEKTEDQLSNQFPVTDHNEDNSQSQAYWKAVESQVGQVPDTFKSIVDYLLNKNKELYERLK